MTLGLFWDNTRVSDFASWIVFPVSIGRCTSRTIKVTLECVYPLNSASPVHFQFVSILSSSFHSNTVASCGVSNVKSSLDRDMDFMSDSKPRLADSMCCCTAYSFPAELQNSRIWELIS